MRENIRLTFSFICAAILLLNVSCRTPQSQVFYNDVVNGKQLEKIPEITLDSFLMVWIEKTNDERGASVREIFKDSAFVYFVKRGPAYYKVTNKSLQSIDYQDINGDSIRQKFYNQIIPTADIKKQENCSTALIDFDFDYFYIKAENAFEIKCHYRVLCELLYPNINKHYKAKYYINTGNIENLTVPKSKK